MAAYIRGLSVVWILTADPQMPKYHIVRIHKVEPKAIVPDHFNKKIFISDLKISKTKLSIAAH